MTRWMPLCVPHMASFLLGFPFITWSFEAAGQDIQKAKESHGIREVHRFDTGEQWIIRIAVSGDGTRALSAGSDGTVRLWNLQTGKEQKRLKGNDGESFTVAFHPQGRLGLSGGSDARLILWDLAKGEKVREFAGHTATISGAAFSPDGTRIASGGWDNTIRLWNVETGNELSKIVGHADGVTEVAFSPDGKRVVSASADKTARIWNVDTGKEVFKLVGHTAMVRGVAYSSDGRHIVSGAWDNDGTARVWDAATGKQLRILDRIPQNVHGVAISPQGDRVLLSGGYQFALWDLERGTPLHKLWGYSARHAVFLPDGEHVLVASADDQLMRLVRVPRNAPLNAEPPITGKGANGVELLDAVMVKHLKLAGTSAATLAISRGRQMLYSRGYGWTDYNSTVPTTPDTPIAVGSCMKPVAAAMIHRLALEGKLELNAPLFQLLGIKPAGRVVDPRVHKITLKHLIDHAAGWQDSALPKADKAYTDSGGQASPPLLFSTWLEKRLSFVMCEKLDWAPGSKDKYDNFGYAVLMHVATKVSGISQSEYIRTHLCRPYGVETLHWVRAWAPPPAGAAQVKGEPPRLWPIAAPAAIKIADPMVDYPHMSAPALCTFMRCYWIDGSPRDNGNPTWVHDGSFDDATAITVWRSDGINYVFLFNGRSALATHDKIGADLNHALERLLKDHRVPAPLKPGHNLLVNGSFEEGPQVSGFLPVDPGSHAIKGWVVTRGQIDLLESHWQPANGKRSLDLHGSPGFGGIAQTFATKSGDRYQVTFSLAGSPGARPSIKRIAVSAAGQKADFAFDSAGKKSDSMGWVEYTWDFKAVAEQTTLELYTLETKDPIAGPALDNVRVEALLNVSNMN